MRGAAGHGDESVHEQLLVGPVILGPEGAHPGILEILKGALGTSLSTIGFDNLGCAPLLSSGREQAQTEVVLLKLAACFEIDRRRDDDAVALLLDIAA